MTNFNYTPTIPAAANNPSSDQPNMQTNFQSIKDLIAVDHTTFQVANGGQHKAITFNQDASYVPGTPVSPPELFTNSVTGVSTPQLFYYSGSAAQSSDQYTITGGGSGTNGSTFLFGGIIIKWMSISVTSGSHPYTFASLSLNDFPNRILNAIVTSQSTTGTAAYVPASSNASQIQINSTASFVASVIAIGD